jgi:hypothetical protein
MAVKFRAGQQLVSAVDSTAVIVIRAPEAEGTLTCGGVAMAAPDQAGPDQAGPDQAGPDQAGPVQPVPAAEADPALMGGTQIGKRYVDEADTIQVLCTKAGNGTLALDGKPLVLQAAKPLPASD